MLETWQRMLKELKEGKGGYAIQWRMENTLEQMKGGLEKCQKPY